MRETSPSIPPAIPLSNTLGAEHLLAFIQLRCEWEEAGSEGSWPGDEFIFKDDWSQVLRVSD